MRARGTEERSFAWLREPAAPGPAPADTFMLAAELRDAAPVFAPMVSLTIAEPPVPPPPVNGLTVGFCVPQNPLIQTLRARAESNLEKLRTCRNLAGFEREVSPYGGPIGLGAELGREGVIAARLVARNTVYRYVALRERAMALVTEAEQVEARYQAALVAAEEEEFRELQFRQQVRLAAARTRLADLRIDATEQQVGLARIQQAAAEFSVDTYQGWIDAGFNEHEEAMLKAYRDAESAQLAASDARMFGGVAQAAANALGAVAQGVGIKGLDPVSPRRDAASGPAGWGLHRALS